MFIEKYYFIKNRCMNLSQLTVRRNLIIVNQHGFEYQIDLKVRG